MQNTSFVQMSEYLENYQGFPDSDKVGIRNHKFMLRLDNNRLKDIDPWDESLDDKVKEMIFIESMNNVWYFMREVVRLNVNGELVPFKLNQSNVAVIWLYEHNQNVAMFGCRQVTYKSTLLDALYSYELFKTAYRNIDNSVELFRNYGNAKFDEFKNILPKYFIDFIIDSTAYKASELADKLSRGNHNTIYGCPISIDRVFVDDFMYNELADVAVMCMQDYNKLFIGAGTIGPHNAKYIAEHGVHFRAEMFDRDIDHFSKMYFEMTGKKPLYSVRVIAHVYLDEDKMKEMCGLLKYDEELIRKEILCQPAWLM